MRRTEKLEETERVKSGRVANPNSASELRFINPVRAETERKSDDGAWRETPE